MKILVVRFSSIGDVILTTPVIRAIHEQRPDCEIHFITKRAFKSLLEHNPHIRKVHAFGHSVKEVLPQLKMERFDRIIDLHHNLRSVLLSFYLGISAVRFQKLNVLKWLFVHLKWNVMPDVHVVDRYFGAVGVLGIKNDQKGGELFLSNQDNVDVKQEFGLESGHYLAVALGAQFATKRMPLELLVKVLSKLEFPTVLCGGEKDSELAASVINSLPEKQIRNACGKFSLLQSASILRQSIGLITNDTGLMHMASCFKVPTVSVWGNTVPELGMYPYFPEDKSFYSLHEVEGLKCRPCSKIGFQSCPKGHFACMNSQNTEEIVAKAKSLFLLKK